MTTLLVKPAPPIANTLFPFHLSPMDFIGNAAPGTGLAKGSRIYIPVDGTLTEIGVYVNNSAGNVSLAVYDTSVTTRNRLAATGSIPCTATNTYTTGSISLPVRAGDHIDVVVTGDDAAFAFPVTSSARNGIAALPASCLVSKLGGKPTIAWASFAAYPLPATLAESGLSTSNEAPLVYVNIVS